MRRTLAALAVLLTISFTVRAEEPFFLKDGQRVVFLGDSNTFAGTFIAYLDAYLVTRFPDQKFELINLGLPSETVSGLSEPDHPYPRPNVHTRVDRALEMTKPDVVVVCYGMNDGIYHPFDKDRFQQYQEGIKKLVEKVKKAGARVVLLSPAPFDPKPLKDKVLGPGAEKYSWMRPFADYDLVLMRYSQWLRLQRAKGIPVADAHDSLSDYLRLRRIYQPDFHFSGDGIHPNATGHWLVAATLLKLWHAPAEVERVTLDLKAVRAMEGKVADLTVRGGAVSFTWTSKVPMPLDPRWDWRPTEAELLADRFNRYRLRAAGALPNQTYTLFEGDQRLGDIREHVLADGVNLLTFPELSTNRRAAEAWKLIEQRQKMLGLAWLTAVGHKRPDTPVGIKLEAAQRQAGVLEEKIRRLAAPAGLKLRLVPTKE